MNKQTQRELLNIVKRNYEEIAEEFSETRKKYLWPELVKLSDRVKSGDKVFDVGCGNGRLLKGFENKNIQYLGVDNSEKLISMAREEYKETGYQFVVENILELSKLSQHNFNYVYSVAVLQHIPGQDLQIAVLKQLKNKVSENGKIIITTWNLWSQKKFRKLIIKFTLLKLIRKNKMDLGDIIFDGFNKKSKRYYHAFHKRELKRIIKSAGLKIDKIYKDKYNYYAILIK